MNLFRFFKWFWDKRDNEDKILMVVLSSVIIILTTTPVFGPIALLVYMLVILALLVSYLIYQGIKELRKQYEIFIKEKDNEADKILNKLKGARRSS